MHKGERGVKRYEGYIYRKGGKVDKGEGVGGQKRGVIRVLGLITLEVGVARQSHAPRVVPPINTKL